ncbi:MAG TPA: hypothetical protein VJM08_13515 [Anaerolineales bacterium]|nr:hypothetical protein [Anaerolineales bacterium]
MRITLEREVNQRWIVYSGPGKSETGTRGSQRVEIPESVEVKEREDVIVNIGGYPVIYNCVKEHWFDNQDGTWNLEYILKHTLE